MHTVPSQVETVTVYRRGARVTRLAEIPQPPEGWPLQLRLTDLPLTMLDASLRAQLQFPHGGGGFVARELRVKIEPLQQPAALTTEADHAQLRHQITLLQCQLDRLDSDISKMKALEPGRLVVSDAQAPESFPLQARMAVVQLRKKNLARWMSRRQQLQARIDELLEHLSRQLACAQAPPLELRKSVICSLRAKPQAQTPHIRLLLSYQVEGACWLPGYSLRFDRDYSLAQLEMRALVCQTSGEDWNNVQLSVSTADPASWTELPHLQSLRLGRKQTLRLPGWRPLPPNSEALLADYDGTIPAPRPLPPDNFGHPPPFLSDSQIVAAALMCLPPDVSVRLFKELGPEQTQAVTLEISKLPQIPHPERKEACEFVAGLGNDLETVARQQSGALVQRLVYLLNSQRPALRPRPAPPAVLESLSRTSSQVADLMCERSPLVSSVVECRHQMRIESSPKPATPQPSGNFRWELSPDQLAFDLLYLPGAGESGRGRLQAQSAVTASLKGWKDRNSAREAMRVLDKAVSEGRAATHRDLPTGYQQPAAIQAQDWLYHGEARLNLVSDLDFHSVPLLRRQLPAALHWLVVPKVTCDVFRRVDLECPADLALPAGPVDLFVGSDYLACVELSAVAAGQSFQLEMGVETALRVVRNATFKEQTAGMMGGTLQLRHEIQVEAQNYLTRPVRLQVCEPLPQVSEGSDCKVRLETQWESLPEQAGHFCWLSLPPGERAGCHFTYIIEMSNRLELVGGNRREK